jgi:hypothetical protein
MSNKEKDIADSRQPLMICQAENKTGDQMAARRWLAAHGPSYARLDPRLSRRRPPLPPANLPSGAGGGRAFPVRLQAVVPSDIEEYLTGVELSERKNMTSPTG